MKIIHAILLGLIQGITEFLPISSSGHLVLFENLFGLTSTEETNLFFDVILHFGTLIAIVVTYRRDIAEMIMAFLGIVSDIFHGNKPKPARSKSDMPARRMVLLIVVATLPLFAVLPFQDALESIRTRPWIVGVMLLMTGILLFFSDRAGKGRKTERSASIVDVLVVGIAQAIGTVPGISRSGSTISAGMFRGFDRQFAVRFSFLMSLPAVLGATLLSTVDAVKEGIDWGLVPCYIVGMAVSAVSGFFAIRIVRFIADKGRFGAFAYYCWAAGLVTIVASVIRTLV